MKYYQDITLLPDEGISVNFLLSKVFQKIHLAIVESRKAEPDARYAVAFPEYNDIGIGKIIRVFAPSKEYMELLALKQRMGNMLEDYVHIINTRVIPVKKLKGNVVFCRQRTNANPEALARRYAKRHKCSFEEAILRYKHDDSSSKLPYIIMTSSSTGQKFSLFIKKKAVTNDTIADFDYYGLGDGVGVPDF